MILLLVYSVLAVSEMRVLDATADEPTYFNSGRLIEREGWKQPVVRLHGPVPYYCNQLFVTDFPDGGYRVATGDPEVLLRGRLGTLPFAWIALLVVFVWSAQVFGARGGLLSAALFALNPLMIGYGGLLAVDMVHAGAVILCLYATWRFLRRPRFGELVWVGASLGLAMGTKYLALLVAPIVVVAVGVRVAARSWRARRLEQPGRALGTALAAGIGVTALALVVLHGLYGFSVGLSPRDPAAYSSVAMRSLVEKPLLGSFLSAFPAPYLWGVDYQLSVGDRTYWRSFVDGHFASWQPTYYLRAFLWKTPELVVLLAAWLAVFRVPRWLRGRGTREETLLAWLLVPAMVVVAGYLSLFTTLKIGIRYVLPLYPMLFVMLGALATLPVAKRSQRLVLGLISLGIGLHAVDLARNWPNLISYFNTAAGGQAHAYRHFLDSNADWAQFGRRGGDILQASEEQPFERLPHNGGPRFGRVAVFLPNLVVADPEDPSRSRHWLDALSFERNLGAAWWLYDVTPEAFETAVARSGDERVRADLALAYLGAGRLEEARSHIARLSPERAAPLQELAVSIERAAQPDVTQESIESLVGAWLRYGRYDLAEAVLRAFPRPDQSDWAMALSRSLLLQARTDEALEVLEQDVDRDRTKDLLLVMLLVEQREYGEAIRILERASETAPSEVTARIQWQLEELRAEQRFHTDFFESLGAGQP